VVISTKSNPLAWSKRVVFTPEIADCIAAATAALLLPTTKTSVFFVCAPTVKQAKHKKMEM
jgi:hypothetical protein